ncbi:MAG TPA: amino acid adenylation domain-containing protein, partial [Candidatus Deferrimicrobium sp.]|nr:amino acid adenylation domain-containing protein [Candidatus Deferrimicrobium sp.]
IRDVATLIAGFSPEHFAAIEPVEKKEYYRVSSAQKRIYILQQLDVKTTGYNMSRVMELEGQVDIKHLEQAVQKLVERHEAFRTSFHMIDDEVVQIIHNHLEFEIEKMIALPGGGTLTEFLRPFDLTCAPLLRAGLAELTENRHLFMVDMHHIVSDGVSIEIMINDFVSFYNDAQLPVMRVQYKDYAEWQQAEKPGGTLLEQKAYWQAQFEGELPVLELPTDYKRPAVQSFAGNSLNFEIGGESIGTLKALALEGGATLYMTLVALYSIFLTKISGQEDIAIGTPMAGRRHADLEKIIGMFVNTLALRSYPGGEKKFSEFLDEIKKMTLKAFENQDFQYEDLVEEIGATRDAGRNPLFDVLFVLQNAGRGIIEIPGLKIKTNEQENLTSKFDLSLVAAEVEDKLSFTFEYSTRLFKQVTIERFKVYFKNVISAVINNKKQKIADIEIITEEEKKQLLFDFNDTGITYPIDKTIPQLFTGQVERTPDSIALVGADLRVCPTVFSHGRTRTDTDNNMSITYRQLNEQSGILAGLLIEKGVQRDSIAGIMVERSLEMIVGILGILKAGAAYLPIDPDFPRERIDYMLKDSGARILIKSEIRNPKFETNPDDQIINNENKNFGIPFVLNFENLNFNSLIGCPRRGLSSNLAYIIYTSGSTGKPKGVLVEHRNVVRLVINPNFIEAKEGQHLLLTGAFTFDIVTFEIWWPLLNGLSLYLPDESTVIGPLEMGKMVSIHRIDILHLVPQLFKQLFSHNAKIFAGLSYFLIGGDPVSPQDIRELRNNYKKLKILHMYGPTENTTFSTYREVDKVGENEESLSIGVPVNNSTVYILGRHDELLPIGVVGQICTGGAGVARGYLNNPELTNDKFRFFWSNFHHSSFIIHHPIHYRTGDLGRWLPDSTTRGAYKLEFLGRVDQQVKIRGFRIELGEIESRLSRYPGITGCVVTAGERKSREKYICAYFTAGEKLEITGIRQYLGRQLPIYMIPAYFMQLDKFPLNLHGKLAKERLPVPEAKKANNFVAPQSNLEKIIAALWKETLELDNICIDDNFFELGGNSLNIVTVNLRLREQLAADISVMTMFRYPTIRTLATYLEQNKDNFDAQKKEIFGAIDRGKSKLRTELKKEKEEVAETGFEIAVIGMAGRFPGARNVE